MPKTNRAMDLKDVAHADLLYAVRCLIGTGKTTANEVRRLVGDRSARIAALRAELATLESGGAVAPAPRAASGRKAGRAPKTARTAKVAVGAKTVRSDGRTFTRTAKVARARKLQGKYLGNLRKLPEKERDRFKKIAREKGVPAAIAAIKTHLSKS